MDGFDLIVRDSQFEQLTQRDEYTKGILDDVGYLVEIKLSGK